MTGPAASGEPPGEGPLTDSLTDGHDGHDGHDARAVRTARAVRAGGSRGRDVRAVGERVEALLADLGEHADPATRARAEELVRALVELYGAGLERVVEAVVEAEAVGVLHRLTGDDLVSGLLILHDLHPLGTAERVAAALDEVLAGREERGELLGVDEAGVVRLRLTGAGHGCPSSRRALLRAVEDAVTGAAPEAARVEITEAAGPAAGRSPLLQIGRRPAVAGGGAP
ncbi:NifU family protein [Streptosporangium sp. NPDC048047]|uniref:NifU family protein n=1 Tax=Streptosporangium sp. NPDC048047 TaxID=3155748 RepID=UPI003446800E